MEVQHDCQFFFKSSRDVMKVMSITPRICTLSVLVPRKENRGWGICPNGKIYVPTLSSSWRFRLFWTLGNSHNTRFLCLIFLSPYDIFFGAGLYQLYEIAEL